VPAIRTVNGRATFENTFLPACSRSYSTTFEDREVLDGRTSQGQKYVLFSSLDPETSQLYFYCHANRTRNLCY
jgi:hypothetical protein